MSPKERSSRESQFLQSGDGLLSDLEVSEIGDEPLPRCSIYYIQETNKNTYSKSIAFLLCDQAYQEFV